MARSFDSRGDSNGSERPLDEDSELLPNSNKNKATPLPSLQLLILAAVRFAEPICYTQVSVLRSAFVKGEAGRCSFGRYFLMLMRYAEIFSIMFLDGAPTSLYFCLDDGTNACDR